MMTRIRVLLLEVAQRGEVLNDVREILRSLLDQARTLLSMVEDVSEDPQGTVGHILGWERRVESYLRQATAILDGLKQAVERLGNGEHEQKTLDNITKVSEMIEDIVDASLAMLRGEDLLME